MKLLAKNLLILASAGSGKTYQLGNRVIGLVASGGAPERIVALTFTRKAAGEFADSVLGKLAAAAADDGVAAGLRRDLELPAADFADALERVVRALPSFTLGTMDSFFAKVVRGFQYELGLSGGRFDLLEGPRAAAATDELLAGVLGGGFLAGGDGEEFFHAFRRATIGREDQGVLAALRAFIGRWQEVYREERALEWGPENLAGVRPDEWPKHRAALAQTVMQGLDEIVFTDKRQRAALEKTLSSLADHEIGSGSLSDKSTLREGLFAAVAAGGKPIILKLYKEFTIDGPAADALRRMVELAACCEFAAALQRTRAVREVVAAFDAVCERRLRRHGMLQFNDVKLLMGEWARGEDARLRREAVDFRLDSRIDHWLLDEFQDTSRADWTGLLPLIDEAATGDDGTMFIVGDRKQAIYAWRGGDVRLFDEVLRRYGDGLVIESMEQSWRSCPEVLELVNRVCGDVTTLHALFGDVSKRWEWRDHVSAEPLKTEGKRGEARVEVVGDFDQRLARLVEILTENGVGQRAMTCGVLLRGNDKVRRVADELRAHGFDVIEEGRRQPALDNPVGIVISQLLQWLADPANAFAREVVEMSPLAAELRARHGESWRAVWEGLTAALSHDGFAKTIGDAIAGPWPGWSDFGRRRAGDLLGALAALDARGGVSPADAADWIARLELSQNPGVAAVQVMTIHKAKGLGFDMVVLPEIPDRPLPEAQHFDIAGGDGWLSETPAKWVRDLIPELRAAEERWAADQRYEGFCMLYVALTRAKRGLYALLDTPPQKPDPDKPSLANWLARSLDSDGAQGVSASSGAAGWSDNIPFLEPEKPPLAETAPGPAIPRRARMSPSAAKSERHAPAHSPTGMRFGSEVHALLERVTWTDGLFPALPRTEAGMAVAKLLENPALAVVFEKRGRNVELFREQAADAILDGCLMSGVIDRLHLHRNDAGEVWRVEIIDYKTDAVKQAEELAGRYSGQMEAYRAALRVMYPAAEIACLLVSVRHGVVVAV
ncbi:MAG: UvrD-helicase domain-containing protein [Akkermansiaceae bacterium]|nr:UvrD-helicase domain-containing protein [Akkermansiaceae bacterium]